MDHNEYAETLVKNFVRNITDHVFLSIQCNDSSMREYLTIVDQHGLDKVNKAIGERVKTLLNLENDGDSENRNPKSHLIKSYRYHKVQ